MVINLSTWDCNTFMGFAAAMIDELSHLRLRPGSATPRFAQSVVLRPVLRQIMEAAVTQDVPNGHALLREVRAAGQQTFDIHYYTTKVLGCSPWVARGIPRGAIRWYDQGQRLACLLFEEMAAWWSSDPYPASLPHWGTCPYGITTAAFRDRATGLHHKLRPLGVLAAPWKLLQTLQQAPGGRVFTFDYVPEAGFHSAAVAWRSLADLGQFQRGADLIASRYREAKIDPAEWTFRWDS